jgi:hypothetical protein
MAYSIRVVDFHSVDLFKKGSTTVDFHSTDHLINGLTLLISTA